MFGQPSGYESTELTSWLEGLARAVDEAAVTVLPDDPVPPKLRDALGAPLFPHAELWSRETGLDLLVALVSGRERIAFWMGR